ncbi:hypothetical protein J2Y73_004620 [Peribacillus frigoritolerans]|uniref:hypothetical protein n=1 Tax=Peribacillus frigoritolerans TaxID=450367 RepID=UPI0020A0576A|nr:hypothetical protein [Peribacillus frigoritolerans]MCP1494589.1 hypothetical protein [Peribacillus frigoritolerans]
MTELTKTKALKGFLNNIGSTVFLLNTICVGLDRVKEEKITEYNDSLRINWSSEDPVNDSQRARIYANKATLAFTVDTLDQYIRSLVAKDNPRIFLEPQLINDLRDNPIGERFDILIRRFQPTEAYWAPFVQLLICWRNRTIHSHAKNTLSEKDIKVLVENKEIIHKNHSGLDVEITLERYLKGQGPTLKDTSTMVAILIKSIRFVDSKIIENELGKEYIIDAAAYQLKSNEKDPISEIKMIWNLARERKQKKMYNLLSHFGLLSGHTNEIVQISLIEDVIDLELTKVLTIINRDGN